VGFGIRVPGIRISTRGVRVGPRFANVGVSYRGRVSGSVGPRIARVHVSGRGVRVGTGLGPLSASVGRGGVRVGAGVGPLFGSVGRGGARVGVGVGPLWATTGGRRSKNRHGTGGASAPRMRANMRTQYERYRDDITQGGSSRRSRDEMRIAGINAAFAAVLPTLAPLQEFAAPSVSLPSESSRRKWAENWARQILSASGGYEAELEIEPQRRSASDIESQARSNLADDGIHSPVHPACALGFKNAAIPSEEELRAWSTTRARSDMGFFGFTLMRGRRKESVRRIAEQTQRDIAAAVPIWQSETVEYDRRLRVAVETLNAEDQARVSEVVSRRNLQLAKLDDLAKQRIEAQESALSMIAGARSSFLTGDPVVNLIVLQAAFSDNGGTAAPVGLDSGDLLVIMTAPTAEEVIWPEELKVGQTISAKKRTKKDVELDYGIFLLCHTLATAKEAFVVAEHVRKTKIIVLDPDDKKSNVFNRSVLGVLTVDRDRCNQLPKRMSDLPSVVHGQKAMEFWNSAVESGDLQRIYSLIDHFESEGFRSYFDFHKATISAVDSFNDCYEDLVGVTKKFARKLSDYTDADVNTSDEIVVSEDLKADDLEILDLNADEMSTPDFWILCTLLAECWDEESVDVAELKEAASAIAACLYPFEESDIDWELRTSNPLPESQK
jgi:hypothetical protein